MSWRRKIIGAVLGYLGLLGLLWLLWWIFGLRFILVLFLIALSPLLLVVFIIVLTLILVSVPIRYNVKAKTDAGGGHAAFVKVSYLFKLVRGRYIYENGEGKLETYIAWFDLGKRLNATKAESHEDDPGHQEPYTAEKSNFLAMLEKYVEPDSVAKPDECEASSPVTPGSKPKFFDKIKSVKEKYAKIKSNVKTVLTYPNRKIIMKLTWRAVKKMFKVLKPKHFDISGTIGFEDPSKTGLFIGLYEALAEPLRIRKNVRLGGNFDTPATAIDLQISVKGSLSIARMTLPIIGLIIKKPIRTLIKDLLSLREEDSNE